jgi:hypothetical protein
MAPLRAVADLVDSIKNAETTADVRAIQADALEPFLDTQAASNLPLAAYMKGITTVLRALYAQLASCKDRVLASAWSDVSASCLDAMEAQAEATPATLLDVHLSRYMLLRRLLTLQDFQGALLQGVQLYDKLAVLIPELELLGEHTSWDPCSTQLPALAQAHTDMVLGVCLNIVICASYCARSGAVEQHVDVMRAARCLVAMLRCVLLVRAAVPGGTCRWGALPCAGKALRTGSTARPWRSTCSR